MMNSKTSPTTFVAPWSTGLKIVTVCTTLICLGGAIAALLLIPSDQMQSRSVAILLPMCLLLGGSLFMIRGYTLHERHLLIHRLFWSTCINLEPLVSAVHDPAAMTRCIRLFGNAGFFSFSGWFRNKPLGTFRAFATDPQRSVVLRFPKRTIVVTPDAPEEFAKALSLHRTS